MTVEAQSFISIRFKCQACRSCLYLEMYLRTLQYHLQQKSIFQLSGVSRRQAKQSYAEQW